MPHQCRDDSDPDHNTTHELTPPKPLAVTGPWWTLHQGVEATGPIHSPSKLPEACLMASFRRLSCALIPLSALLVSAAKADDSIRSITEELGLER
jgi:hypothetical protein